MNYELNYELNRTYRKQMEFTANQRRMVDLFSKPAQTVSPFYSGMLAIVWIVAAIVLGIS